MTQTDVSPGRTEPEDITRAVIESFDGCEDARLRAVVAAPAKAAADAGEEKRAEDEGLFHGCVSEASHSGCVTCHL